MSSDDDSDIIPVPKRVKKKNGSFRNSLRDEINFAEYLSWRRLHLSKSKLSNVTEMASYMAGFAVVGTVELQINDQDASPPLLTAFGITTALLVGTCMIAITISTCVLPHMEAVAKTSKMSSPDMSPHDKMTRLVDISWILTNSVSLFLFTVDMILMGWIKYTFFTRAASIAGTLILAPVLVIIIVFGILFYRKILKHKYIVSRMKYEELEEIHVHLERTTSLNSVNYHGNQFPSSLQHSHSHHPAGLPQRHHHHPQAGPSSQRNSRRSSSRQSSSRSESQPRTRAHSESISLQNRHSISRSSSGPNVYINTRGSPNSDSSHGRIQAASLRISSSDESFSPYSVQTV